MDSDALRMHYRPQASLEEVARLGTIYKPLDVNETRLLHLAGHDANGVLSCNLSHIDMNAAPYSEDVKLSHIAIDYTWDTDDRIWYGNYTTEPKTVRIDGKLVLISDKVANILSLMCQRNKTIVWIDAICINQDDSLERSQQVLRMGDIFSHAQEVVSFLGSPSNATDAVLNPINWEDNMAFNDTMFVGTRANCW